MYERFQLKKIFSRVNILTRRILSAFNNIIQSIIKNIFKIYKLAFIVPILFVLFVLIREIPRKIVTVESFDVPNELDDIGFNGRVVAKKLMDKIYDVGKAADTDLDRMEFSSSWTESLPELEVEGSGVSIKSFVQYLKKEISWRKPLIINGEIIKKGCNYYLTIRIVGKSHKTFKFKEDNFVQGLDNALFSAAQHSYLYTQPFILASYLCEQKHHEECVNIAIDIIKDDNSDKEEKARSFVIWGQVMQSQKKYSEAIEKYEMAIQIMPELSSAHINLGLVHQIMNKNNLAVERYKIVTNINKKNAYAYYNWGRLLQGMKNNDAAIEKYHKTIQINPRYYEAYYNWGGILLVKKNYSEALEKFKDAINTNPRYTKAYFNLAIAYLFLDDKQKAIDKFDMAATLEPDADLGRRARNEADKLRKIMEAPH